MITEGQQYAIGEYLFLQSCGMGMRDILRALRTTPTALTRMFSRAGRGDLAQQIIDVYPRPKAAGDDTVSERWKRVSGRRGYEVSTLGRARSLDRTVTDSLGRRRNLRGQLLTPVVSSNKHFNINFGRGGPALLHRVILETFIGPCPEGREGCHHNDDPTDNRLQNLYWGTRRENMLDRVRNGRHHLANLTHCAQGHEFTPANTYEQTTGGRGCRECRRVNALRYRERAVPMPDCTFPDCGRTQRSKGLCVGHYAQQAKGKPLTPLRGMRVAPLEVAS